MNLRKKTGPETALETLERHAEVNPRFKALLAFYHNMEITYPYFGVDCYMSNCGLSCGEKQFEEIASLRPYFKAGALSHITLADANGVFKIKVGTKNLTHAIRIWFTPAGREMSEVWREEADAKAEARLAVMQSPEYEAKVTAREKRRTAKAVASKIADIKSRIAALQSELVLLETETA